MVLVSEADDTAMIAAESFKPYARSLSHELRTPMHGVVGMLDVMQATVQEAIESQQNPKIRDIFRALQANIEVVQGRILVTVPSSVGLRLIWKQIVHVAQSRLQIISFTHMN